MWFLDTAIFTRMILACLVLMVTSIVSTKVFGKNVMKHLLLPFDLLLMGYVSWQLCVFYICYTLITYGFVKLLKKSKKCRKALFVYHVYAALFLYETYGIFRRASDAVCIGWIFI